MIDRVKARWAEWVFSWWTFFEVGTGDLRSVRNIALAFGNTEGGYAGAINDLGHVTFGLEFTDGTSGIFLVTVPEPCVPGVLCCACVALTRRGRRTRGRA